MNDDAWHQLSEEEQREHEAEMNVWLALPDIKYYTWWKELEEERNGSNSE